MKHLKISLALISTILLSSAAFADNYDYSGVYIEGQLGWANAHNNINPVNAGFFTGGLPGLIMSNLFDAANLGGKLSIGYQFNQNFAVQVGAFGAASYKTNAAVEPNYKSALAYYDVAAKGMLPISQSVTLDGLLGIAYGVQAVSGSTVDAPNGTNTELMPEFGGGVAYNFTPNFNISLSTLVIPGDKAITPTFFIPLGISYRF